MALLEATYQHAAQFPVKIAPEDGYVAAACRGKLVEFDRAAKAIVDEMSCGGLIPGWSAIAGLALARAQVTNQRQLPE